MSNWRKTKSEPSTTRWQRRHRRLLTSHESRGTQSPLRACSLVSDWPPGTHENGLCRGPLTYLGEGRGEKEARGKKEVRWRVASVCVGGERRCERRCASFFRFFFSSPLFSPFLLVLRSRWPSQQRLRARTPCSVLLPARGSSQGPRPVAAAAATAA